MKASAETIRELEGRLGAAAKSLSSVDGKKMFGCHALFAKGNVFALVWTHGRIGVKLPDEKDYARAMGLEGAAPWTAGPMKMAHWVLLPELVQKDERALTKWVARAHELALQTPPKAAKKSRAK
jgi:TfoX/Sxy family transcriptional regulator of competence genes